MYRVEDHKEIPKSISSKDDLDFEWLRAQGQKYIEDLSHKLWTDYNIHDPGITIMELLCYAITDLGLRINQPIENLLASPEQQEDNMHKMFKSALNILTTKPVTANDYRKLFIDIEGVKNAWLSAYPLEIHVECNPNKPKIDFKPFEESIFNTTSFPVKGLYKVLIDYEKDADTAAIEKEIFKTYHNNRNLCEDLVEVKEVPKQCIRVCADIQLQSGVDEEKVHAEIIFAVEQYFSPHLPTYNLQELLDKSMPTDEIFEGPVLNNGFILDEDLERTHLRKEVRLSDLINLISATEGVSRIEDISIDNCPKNPDDDSEDCQPPKTANSDAWIICIEPDHKPALCDKSTWKYKKGLLPVGINKAKAEAYLEEIEQTQKAQRQKTYEDLDMPLGQFSDLTAYQTVQHELPENYGISPYGLPKSVSTKRKVQAKQLQAYMMFFDQIFNVYFSHLGQVKALLSGDKDLKRHYVFKAVKDIEGWDSLINDATIFEADPTKGFEEGKPSIINDLESFKAKRHELLDHLISRFAEVFEDYSSVMFKLFGTGIDEDILTTKMDFLNHYDEISSERCLAFNYRKKTEDNQPDVWNTDNVSGFQKRMALLSGMPDFSRKNLYNEKLIIEELTGSGGKVEYRWVMKDSTQIYLSSDKKYKTKQKAINNLLRALKLAYNADNLRLHPTTNGNKVYIILTTAEYAETPDEEFIIGKQFNRYFTDEEAVKPELEKIQSYLKSLQNDEGFYLIEHLLSLPYHSDEVHPDIQQCLPLCVEKNCLESGLIDPFSYQVTIVFPGYTNRFSNVDFRNFMEKLIRRELPAHILTKICWVGHMKGMPDNTTEDETPPTNDTKNIQEAWQAFLISKNRPANNYMASIKSTKDLWCALKDLHTIYSSGTLHDCENEDTEEQDNRIILNRSSLGTL